MKNGSSKMKKTEENIKSRKLLPIYVNLAILIGCDVIILENAREASSSPEMRKAIRDLKKNGYEVHCEILLAADYGVPQMRERTILVATRGDWSFTWPKKHARHITVKEALSQPPIPAQRSDPLSEAATERVEGKRKTLGFMHNKVDMNKPAKTLITIKGSHVFECDGGYFFPSTEESLRLQSFPSTFAFPDPVSEGSRYKMIGNAVPPALAAAIAKGLKRISSPLHTEARPAIRVTSHSTAS